MSEDALVCDGCASEAKNEGALVLVLDTDRHRAMTTVRRVHVACGSACLPKPDREGATVTTFSFDELGDVFDFADRVLVEHDWESGTIQRLSRVLVALHDTSRRAR